MKTNVLYELGVECGEGQMACETLEPYLMKDKWLYTYVVILIRFAIVKHKSPGIEEMTN